MRSRRNRRAAARLTIFVLAAWAGETAGAQDSGRKVVQTQAVVQAPDRPDEKSRAASMATLQGLVDSNNYRQLGFESPAEAAKAVTGEGIRRYIIHPNRLLAYNAAMKPESLLVETTHWILPVLVGEAVRCGITLAWRGDQGWRGISFGDSNNSIALFETRKQAAAGPPPVAVQSFFLVDVLGTGRRFLARRASPGAAGAAAGPSRLLFTWIGPPPAGVDRTQPAEAVLERLSKSLRAVKRGAPGK